jgi:hypothetical protein
MPEKFPDKPQQKFEGKEGVERKPRYRTISSEVIEPLKDGTETVRVVECNGVNHRRCVDKISYDEKGEIIFADQLSREELGPCDGQHS